MTTPQSLDETHDDPAFHPSVPLEDVEIRSELADYFARSAEKHRHLCPRQILGVRMGIACSQHIGLTTPRTDKKMMVIVETDGCFISGVEAATGCSVNRRTMRVVDFGRIAATFINVKTEQAVRIAPRHDIRQRAFDYAPNETRRYFAMLHGYQAMPQDELLRIEPVVLTLKLKELISRPGVRTNCSVCGEEIINERELLVEGATVCRSCAGQAYYRPANA